MYKSIFLPLFIVFCIAGMYGFAAASQPQLPKPETTHQVTVSTGDYTGASSVLVQLLAANGSVITQTVTAPGTPAQFEVEHGTYLWKIRKTYSFGAGTPSVVEVGTSIIVVDDIVF